MTILSPLQFTNIFFTKLIKKTIKQKIPQGDKKRNLNPTGNVLNNINTLEYYIN